MADGAFEISTVVAVYIKWELFSYNSQACIAEFLFYFFCSTRSFYGIMLLNLTTGKSKTRMSEIDTVLRNIPFSSDPWPCSFAELALSHNDRTKHSRQMLITFRFRFIFALQPILTVFANSMGNNCD